MIKNFQFSELFDFLPKSKRKASEALNVGDYPFYKSSCILSGFCDDYDFEAEKLIFGTGGSASIHHSMIEFATSTDCFVADLKNKNAFYTRYVFHFLLANIHLLEKGFKGAGLRHISKKYIQDLIIPIPHNNGKPDLDEQKRIAAILDKAEGIRRKRRQALQLTNDFLRSLFIDMFGDPVTNPKGWDVVEFNDVGKLDRGKSKHRPRNAPELLGGDYPLIQTGDVANSSGYIRTYRTTYSELGLKQSKMWPEGTLCITIAANIAKTGILTFPACFPDSVVGFKPNKRTCTEYIQVWLSFLQKTLEEQAPMAAQKNINLSILRKLKVPLPPFELQLQFASSCRKHESMKMKFYENITESENLFASLQQRAFKGEL